MFQNFIPLEFCEYKLLQVILILVHIWTLIKVGALKHAPKIRTNLDSRLEKLDKIGTLLRKTAKRKQEHRGKRIQREWYGTFRGMRHYTMQFHFHKNELPLQISSPYDEGKIVVIFCFLTYVYQRQTIQFRTQQSSHHQEVKVIVWTALCYKEIRSKGIIRSLEIPLKTVIWYKHPFQLENLFWNLYKPLPGFFWHDETT